MATIAPLTSQSPAPAGPLQAGPGIGLTSAVGGPTALPSYDAASLAQGFLPTQQQQMARNPMLPQHPTDAALDSQYLAEEAVLRANIAKQYADVLQQLGYTDEKGGFIPGSVATNAGRQEADLRRSSDLAAEDTTHQAQREGTLFSGLRGTAQARAQYPFQQQIQELGINVPMQLGQLHEQAAGLVDQYSLQNNQLLAAAAQRRAAALAQSGGGGGVAVPGAAATPGPSTLDEGTINPIALSPRPGMPTTTPTVLAPGGAVPGGVFRADPSLF